MKKASLINYTTLFDKSGKKRGVICVIGANDSGFVGVSFRSDDDKWSEKTGQNIARNRAHRAQRVRKPCYVTRKRVINYIMDLRRDSFKVLMGMTGNILAEFPKSFIRIGSKTYDMWYKIGRLTNAKE